MARPRLRHGVRQPFGRIAGVQHLEFARVPARRGASRGTIVVLLGGPGQPALPFARDIAADALFADHDLLLVAPRGTGLSDPTGCVVRALPGSARGAREAAACAARLGARRATLTSEEDARDLEDVRVALGIPSLTVLGISSGTRVAAEYVRRFPASTDHVVLDSPVAFDGVDAIGQLPSLSFPRVLKEVCWPPGCVGISGPADPRRTVGRLVARLERRPLRTVVVDTSGVPHSARVGTALLHVLLRASDADPVLRVDLPAAMRSALNGDGAYLARLVSSAATTGDQAQESTATDEGRFLATTCIESRLPWKPDAPLAGRPAALRAQLAALAPQLLPFPPALVASFSAEPACVAWPPTSQPSPVSLQAPPVPTLIVAGREDLRTPVEDARRTAAEYPNARLLTVPDTGHSVLSSDLSGCADRRVGAFLAGAPVANCERRQRPLLDPAPFIPASIGALPRAPGVPGLAGRTLTAVAATVVDATRASVRGAAEGGRRLGGETLRGVRVSGTVSVRAGGSGRLTVSGPSAAAGAITVTRSRTTGTLGGVRISLRGRGPLG